MAKRSNGEGYIYQNKRGQWIVRVQFGWLDNGNPRFKTFSGKTRKEALAKKAEFDIESKISPNTKETLLSTAMKLWLQTKKKLSLKPSSYARVEMTVNSNILPRIGNYYVNEITSDLIQRKIISDMFDEGFAWSTIKKCFDALNEFFRQKVAERRVSHNPIEGVTMPTKHMFIPKQTRSLQDDEISRFADTCTATFSNGALVYKNGYGFLFILYTGIRSGEALALQYKHINLLHNTLTVEQSAVCIDVAKADGSKRCEVLLQNSTKTASGDRVIPLSEKAVSAIKSYMSLYYKGDENEFVFATKSGSPMLYRNFRKSVNSVYKAANIDASGFHILRHTAASKMFENNMDIKHISALLGHSGVQITYDTYVHLKKSYDAETIKKLNY